MLTGYKGLSLSDNPFVFFARCGTNKIAHVSIHHPFAKEELLLNQKPVDSDTGKWVGFIFMVIVVIGFSMALIGTFGWLIHKLYTEYAYNWISIAIALISLSGAVFFADELHNLEWNWFFCFLGIQIFYLFLMLLDAGSNNK